jgi:hypothetical protein
MKEILAALKGFPEPVLPAIIAVCGVLISALIVFVASRKTLYLNAVTSERSKWIDNLRKNIASYSGEVRTLNMMATNQYFLSNGHKQSVEKINALTTLIKLQLNPFNEIDQNLIILLDIIPSLAEQQSSVKLIRNDNLLVMHSQYLLKAEWEKVKFESRGICLKVWLWFKAKCHMRRYRKFCRGEGRIDRVCQSST